MRLIRTKNILVLSAISLISFVVFLSFCLFFAGDGAYHGAFVKKQADFSVELKSSGEVILSPAKAEKLAESRQILCLKNNEKENTSFSVYQNGKLKAEMTLSSGEEKDFEMDSDGGKLSLLVQNRDCVAYLTDSESFRAIHQAMPDGGDLIFLSQSSLGKEFVRGPFRFFGDFTFDELSVETEKGGDIVLYPNEAFQGTLYVSAENSEIFWKRYTPSFDKSQRNFYLKAKAVNEKKLSLSDYPVTSFDQLSRLAAKDQLPHLCDGATLRICKSIQMKSSLAFSALVSLDVQKKIDFDGNILKFSSEKDGTYRVKTALGTGLDGTSLLFEAPLADLVWTGDGTIPALSTVEKYSNVKTYNAAKFNLGGEGKAVPQLVLLADESKEITQDVPFSLRGNCLIATLPYLSSRKGLSDENFALSCDDGTVKVEGSISDGVIVTEDSDGNKRRFAIEITRDPYQIPVVHLETEGGAEITSKSQYISATFALDGGESEYDSLSETHIRIRGRGNSTWKWEKKPYKIHFDEPTSILGLPAAEEWALLSNYADKSLMRNRLAQVMASKLSFEYCPTQVCVDVFLNGEYLGVYTLGEHLESGEGRVEIDYDMTQTDCGYFLEAGGVVSGVDVKGMNYFHAGLVKFVLIKTPEYNMLTSEQFDYIHNFMLKADEAVKKGEGYEEYLDVDSVIDWLIMIELSCNTDCTWRRSTFFTKEPGGKLVMGPVWDFDLAFGNFSKDNPGDDTWVSSEPDDDYVGETWSTHLLKDPEFQARFKARWQEVRDVLVDTAMEEIERQYQLNSASAELNFQRWDILGKKVAFERHDTSYYPTYDSQIYYLQDFINNRADWIDEQMENFA